MVIAKIFASHANAKVNFPPPKKKKNIYIYIYLYINIYENKIDQNFLKPHYVGKNSS